MPRVKLNIRGLSTTEKVAKARQIITALTANPAFTTPQPPLATITTAADELETAHAETQTARQTAVTKTSIMHEKEAALEALLRQLAGYIESVAGDDEPTILSAGISVRTTTPATQLPATPIALGATEGDHDGEIDLSWDTVKGAKSYVIEREPRPAHRDFVGARDGLTQVFGHGRRLSERHTLLVPSRCCNEQRSKRLERPRNQDRPLNEG